MTPPRCSALRFLSLPLFLFSSFFSFFPAGKESSLEYGQPVASCPPFPFFFLLFFFFFFIETPRSCRSLTSVAFLLFFFKLVESMSVASGQRLLTSASSFTPSLPPVFHPANIGRRGTFFSFSPFFPWTSIATRCRKTHGRSRPSSPSLFFFIYQWWKDGRRRRGDAVFSFLFLPLNGLRSLKRRSGARKKPPSPPSPSSFPLFPFEKPNNMQA